MALAIVLLVPALTTLACSGSDSTPALAVAGQDAGTPEKPSDETEVQPPAEEEPKGEVDAGLVPELVPELLTFDSSKHRNTTCDAFCAGSGTTCATTCKLPSGKVGAGYDYAKDAVTQEVWRQDVKSCSAAIATTKASVSGCCCLVAPTQMLTEVIKSPKSCEEVCSAAGLACIPNGNQQVSYRDAQGKLCSTELGCKSKPDPVNGGLGCGLGTITRAELLCSCR
jgi:hypothetical protein